MAPNLIAAEIKAANPQNVALGDAGAALTALVHRVELSRDGLRLSLKVPVPPSLSPLTMVEVNPGLVFSTRSQFRQALGSPESFEARDRSGGRRLIARSVPSYRAFKTTMEDAEDSDPRATERAGLLGNHRREQLFVTASSRLTTSTASSFGSKQESNPRVLWVLLSTTLPTR